ncbi:Cdc15p [Rhizophagus irregularis DAOM 197198w]|uniref:Cdc15p n=1 Tax=Rhizophagus irregularis (strain DAOM 197198w) TaxID=1432141 RepID=A0A015N2L4_RHIIW|nr:Cdc15p [Rhizophagus irregularis DAOM 197198w]
MENIVDRAIHGDSKLDELIQNFQLNAPFSSQLIEWIEYSNLENIELIANGGFGSVYKAIWKDGPIIDWDPWDMNKHKWQRIGETIVAVKKFRNATQINSEFLNEINITLKMNNSINDVSTIKIYGVARDLQNGEYAIVTDFKDGGNMREFIKKNHSELTWKKFIRLLIHSIWTLWQIHDKNYYHRDLHSGNILNSINKYDISPAISDFGLGRPMDQSSTDKTSYGVLPFVAPEVLRGDEFTEAADIYGFGMIMSELISGEPPFVDREYDMNLALAICNGQRPQIPEYTPEPYAKLMKRCWDPVPTNRPTAKALSNKFKCLLIILCPVKDESNESIELSEDDLSEDFILEVEEAFSQEREDKWKLRLAELATNPIPLKKSQNLLTSKRLNFSESLSLKLSVEDWNKLRLTD